MFVWNGYKLKRTTVLTSCQQLAQSVKVSYQLTDTGRIYPTVPPSYHNSNQTPTSQPTEILRIKSQSIAPDGKRKIMIKAPAKIVYGSPQQILVSDASGGNETIVLNQDFTGGSFADLNPANWSPHGEYFYVYMGFVEGGDLFIFQANGALFSNRKRYLLASEFGYPQTPSTPTWITNTQIQLLTSQVGPIVTNKQYTYIFDVDKQTVTLRK